MFSITIAMMIIGTIVTFVSSIGHSHVTCNMMFRALGIVLIPSLQLYFSVLFAHIYVIIDAPNHEKLAICLVYPLFISIGKEAMVKLDYYVFNKSNMIEFLSLILADLPYRFLYFELFYWYEGCVLIAIKFIYKTIRYPVMTLNAEEIQKLKDKISCSKTKTEPADTEANYYVPGYPEAQNIDVLREETSTTLFYHSFNDMLSIISVMLLLFISRFLDSGFLSQVDLEYYQILMTLFAIELFLDIVFFILATRILKRGLKQFEPLKLGSEEVYKLKSYIFCLILLTYPLVFTIVSTFKVIII